MTTPTLAPLVLVVDDYDDARVMYGECLLLGGYRVVEARNGEAAVAQARALSPDVILMDLSLPGLDGWDATRQLKADPGTRHIPVVALTGHAAARATDRAREAGCDRLLIKPALPDAVVNEVRAVITQITGRDYTE